MICVLILLPLPVWEPFRGSLYHESILTLALPPVPFSDACRPMLPHLAWVVKFPWSMFLDRGLRRLPPQICIQCTIHLAQSPYYFPAVSSLSTNVKQGSENSTRVTAQPSRAHTVSTLSSVLAMSTRSKPSVGTSGLSVPITLKTRKMSATSVTSWRLQLQAR